MKVFKGRKELVSYLTSKSSLSQNKCLGFVPTMGALHEGHLKLIQRAKSECTTAIASIFVNPNAFNNINDFKNYPNTLDSDLTKLQTLSVTLFTFQLLKTSITTEKRQKN